jgi:hypothetical protein
VKWQGEVRAATKRDGAFEEFEDMAHGYRALMKLLYNYRTRHGCRTIADFINRWAPSCENNTQGYIRRVCRDMGVTADHIPDVGDRATMIAMASAISQVENGIPAVAADVEAGWALFIRDAR